VFAKLAIVIELHAADVADGTVYSAVAVVAAGFDWPKTLCVCGISHP
jgi:hypothetical protein